MAFAVQFLEKIFIFEHSDLEHAHDLTLPPNLKTILKNI